MSSLEVMISQILLCALLAITGIEGKPPKAIVRGDGARVKEFPYSVALKAFGQYICSGVIIDPTHILTAGHCLEVPRLDVIKGMVVITGGIKVNKGNLHRIKSVKFHEMFSSTVVNTVDLGMITLRTPIEFNHYQKAVSLPTQDTPDNITATFSGWGILEYPSGEIPKILQKLEMNVINNSECNLPLIETRDWHICAKPKKESGLCRGDSGGPLVSDGVLIGIASFVVPCARGFPDVFMRVANFLDWIKEARKN